MVAQNAGDNLLLTQKHGIGTNAGDTEAWSIIATGDTEAWSWH